MCVPPTTGNCGLDSISAEGGRGTTAYFSVFRRSFLKREQEELAFERQGRAMMDPASHKRGFLRD